MNQQIQTGADRVLVFEDGIYCGSARPQDSEKKAREALEEARENGERK